MEEAIEQEMYHYFVQLDDAQKLSVVQLLKTFVKDSQRDYNKELEQADADIEAGEYVPHEEVMKRYYKQ